VPKIIKREKKIIFPQKKEREREKKNRNACKNRLRVLCEGAGP